MIRIIWSRVHQFFQGLPHFLEFIEILLYKDTIVAVLACASKLPLGQERQHQNLYLCGLNDDEATKKYPSKAVFKCVCLPERVAERGKMARKGMRVSYRVSHCKLYKVNRLW